MSNLGAYQVITTAAKEAGGVDKLISAIKKAAVDGAALRLRVQGVGIGVTGTLVVGGAVAAASRLRGAKKARQERAEEAEKLLKAKLQEPGDAERNGS
ncbi:hypothetical protein [Streptomyces sp. NPDC046727]|uniref:hypothetical protein n=1 Tax=Streptomyces sp. NPDC046727 TaxID=3155373 RepID=UPI0033CE5CFA